MKERFKKNRVNISHNYSVYAKTQKIKKTRFLLIAFMSHRKTIIARLSSRSLVIVRGSNTLSLRKIFNSRTATPRVFKTIIWVFVISFPPEVYLLDKLYIYSHQLLCELFLWLMGGFIAVKIRDWRKWMLHQTAQPNGLNRIYLKISFVELDFAMALNENKNVPPPPTRP